MDAGNDETRDLTEQVTQLKAESQRHVGLASIFTGMLVAVWWSSPPGSALMVLVGFWFLFLGIHIYHQLRINTMVRRLKVLENEQALEEDL